MLGHKTLAQRITPPPPVHVYAFHGVMDPMVGSVGGGDACLCGMASVCAWRGGWVFVCAGDFVGV